MSERDSSIQTWGKRGDISDSISSAAFEKGEEVEEFVCAHTVGEARRHEGGDGQGGRKKVKGVPSPAKECHLG